MAEETEEIEINEDDIYAYIFDEEDNELGFIVKDEDGAEHEYYYAEPVPAEESDALAKVEASKPKKNKKPGEIDADDIAEATKGMNEVYKESHEVLSELNEMMKDIQKDLRDMTKTTKTTKPRKNATRK